jgi:ketosteroid isomerase-like protein
MIDSVKKAGTALLGAALLVAVAGAGASASDKTDVVATVNQFMNGFNHGDAKSALAACAPHASIIDEFAPHVWSSCSDWANAFAADAKKNGITGGMVTLGAFRHDDVDGDSAYVVAPATYAYKVHRKPATEAGAVLTVALRKSAGAWRITAWTWSEGR